MQYAPDLGCNGQGAVNKPPLPTGSSDRWAFSGLKEEAMERTGLTQAPYKGSAGGNVLVLLQRHCSSVHAQHFRNDLKSGKYVQVQWVVVQKPPGSLPDNLPR